MDGDEQRGASPLESGRIHALPSGGDEDATTLTGTPVIHGKNNRHSVVFARTPPAPFTPNSVPSLHVHRQKDSKAPRSHADGGDGDHNGKDRDKGEDTSASAIVRKFQRQNPILFKMIVTGGTGAVGEMISQKILAGTITLRRNTAAFFVAGAIYIAPFFHYWHPLVDKVIVPNGSTYPVAKKLLLDRLIVSPPFNAVYMLLLALLNGKSATESIQTVRQNLLNVVKKSFQFWVVVNSFSYSQVPLDLRIYFGNLMGIVWTTYLAISAKPSS